MKFDQFAYWLKGYFELVENVENLEECPDCSTQFPTTTPSRLTASQVACIKNHIQLHLECALREEVQPEPFICWLDGSLLYFDKLPQSNQESLVLEVKARLNNLFIHKIDTALPGDKKSLQDIHDGKGEKKIRPKKPIGRDIHDGKGEKKIRPKKPIGRGKALERRPGEGRDRRLMC
jgi:hypothetical protein